MSSITYGAHLDTVSGLINSQFGFQRGCSTIEARPLRECMTACVAKRERGQLI